MITKSKGLMKSAFNRYCDISPFFYGFEDMFDEIRTNFPTYKDKFGGSIISNWIKKPLMNQYETEKEYVIELSIPGISKEDIKIELTDDILTIKGHKKIEKTDKKTGYSEFSSDTFERSLFLPESVDTENIRSKHENGILKLSLSKLIEEKTKTTREIKID